MNKAIRHFSEHSTGALFLNYLQRFNRLLFVISNRTVLCFLMTHTILDKR